MKTNRSYLSEKAWKISFLGILFSLSLLLSFVETFLFSAFFPPGIRIGLSNIVLMELLLFMNAKAGGAFLLLKTGFTFITKGGAAALFTLGGGFFSLFVLLLILYLRKGNPSCFFWSVNGSLAHNLGQALVGTWILRWSKAIFFSYLPVLILSGVIAGAFTGFLLKLSLPASKNMFAKKMDKIFFDF